MARPPLLARSMVNGRRYLLALVFMLIGFIPFAFLALGIAIPPLPVIAVGVALIAYGPCSAINTFLEYPRLILSGNKLTIWSNPFWPTRHDLTPYGAAYAVHQNTRSGLGTVLAFRTEADEAAHRAAEKYPFGPEYAEASKTVPVNHFVGRDLEKAEALAAAVNVHRGL